MEVYVDFSKPVNDYCAADSVNFGPTTPRIAGGVVPKAQGMDVHFTKGRGPFDAVMFKHLLIRTVFTYINIEFWRGDTLLTMYSLSGGVITAISQPGDTTSVSLNGSKVELKRFEN